MLSWPIPKLHFNTSPMPQSRAGSGRGKKMNVEMTHGEVKKTLDKKMEEKQTAVEDLRGTCMPEAQAAGGHLHLPSVRFLAHLLT